jgi:hypothetical protein
MNLLPLINFLFHRNTTSRTDHLLSQIIASTSLSSATSLYVPSLSQADLEEGVAGRRWFAGGYVLICGRSVDGNEGDDRFDETELFYHIYIRNKELSPCKSMKTLNGSENAENLPHHQKKKDRW